MYGAPTYNPIPPGGGAGQGPPPPPPPRPPYRPPPTPPGGSEGEDDDDDDGQGPGAGQQGRDEEEEEGGYDAEEGAPNVNPVEGEAGAPNVNVEVPREPNHDILRSIFIHKTRQERIYYLRENFRMTHHAAGIYLVNHKLGVRDLNAKKSQASSSSQAPPEAPPEAPPAAPPAVDPFSDPFNSRVPPPATIHHNIFTPSEQTPESFETAQSQSAVTAGPSAAARRPTSFTEMLGRPGYTFETGPEETASASVETSPERAYKLKQMVNESIPIVDKFLSHAKAYSQRTILPAIRTALDNASKDAKNVTIRIKNKTETLSIDAARFIVSNPEAILAGIWAWGFFTVDYQEYFDHYPGSQENVREAIESWASYQKMKHVAMGAGIYLTTKQLFKEIIGLIKEYYMGDIHNTLVKIFQSVQRARQYETRRFAYAEEHMFEPEFLDRQPLDVDLIEALAAELAPVVRGTPVVEGVVQPEQRPSKAPPVTGLNASEPLPQPPPQRSHPPGTTSAGPAQGKRGKPDIPGTTQAVGKRGKPTYTPGKPSSSSGAGRFPISKKLVTVSENKAPLGYLDTLNDYHTFH